MEDHEIRVPLPGEHYEHYRGGRYEVIAVGRLSEQRDAIMVVYRSLERGHVWIRPFGMWSEVVEHDGTRMPRFRLAEDSPPSVETMPLTDEERDELDREMAAIVLTRERPYERQRCQHLRASTKVPSYAAVRLTTTPDGEASIKWDCRLELELCTFCAGYAMSPLLSVLRSDPILCAAVKK